MTCPTSEAVRVREVVDWFDGLPIPPLSCHGCTALFLCLASDRVDHLGQLHFDGPSRVAVDVPRLHSLQWLEDAREVRAYRDRGEAEVWRSLNGERTYIRVFFPACTEAGQGPWIGEVGEYVLELDGDPEEDW